MSTSYLVFQPSPELLSIACDETYPYDQDIVILTIKSLVTNPDNMEKFKGFQRFLNIITNRLEIEKVELSELVEKKDISNHLKYILGLCLAYYIV